MPEHTATEFRSKNKYGTLLDFGYIEIKYQDRYTLFDLLLNYANHKKHIELVDILNNQM